MPLRLEKTTISTFTPYRPGTPGFAGQPYLPPRSIWEPYQVCSHVSYTPQEIAALYADYGVRYEIFDGVWQLYVPPGFAIQIPSDRLVCRTEYQLVHLPAQPYLPPIAPTPATPASTTYEFQLGWNSRARSIALLRGPGRAQFTIPSTVVGAVVGFTSTPANSGFEDIQWGFRMGGGILSIVERGITVYTVGAVGAPELTIERSLGEIRYLVDDVEVRSLPDYSNNVPIYLGAALYSGGDSVMEASLLSLPAEGYGEATFMAPDAIGSDTIGYAQGVAILAPPEAAGYADSMGYGEAVLAAPDAIGAGPGGYAQGIAVLAPGDAEGEGFDAEAPAIAIGIAHLLPPDAVGSGLTGYIGSGSASFPPPDAIGADASGYAQGVAVSAAPGAYGENFLPTNQVVIANTILAASEPIVTTTLFAVLNSGFGLEGIVSVQVIGQARVDAQVGLGFDVVSQATLQAIIASLMEARASAFDASASDDFTVWALNTDLADKGGTTRYTNYDFNSFAKIGLAYFGARADGLYRLQGRDDGEEDVHAEINFGNRNFGMLERKSLPHVYAGVASDGRLVLQVTEESGQTYHYAVRGQSAGMRTQRFDLGKGLRANYYEIILLNDGGSVFDLSIIEFAPVKLSRRL